MKYDGKRKIILALRKQSLTLTELSKITKLSKPTISHHLSRLQTHFITKNEQTGKFTIFINSELKKFVLNLLLREIPTSKIISELKKDAKKERTGIVEKFVLKPDFREMLNDLLKILLDLGLIFERPNFRSSNNYKNEYSYRINWQGCNELEICHVCKEKFDPEDVAVVDTRSISSPEVMEEIFAPLLHPKCVMEEINSGSEEVAGYSIYDYDLCQYCGLPLSLQRLEGLIDKSKFGLKSGFDLIYDFLTIYEISLLKKYRKKEIIKHFKLIYGEIEVPEDLFTGDILHKTYFEFKITEKLAKQILKHRPNAIQFKHFNWNRDPYFEKMYHPQSFMFLTEPNLSSVQKLIEIMISVKDSKGMIDLSTRSCELHSQWMSTESQINDKIDGFIGRLFQEPHTLIFPKLRDSYLSHEDKNRFPYEYQGLSVIEKHRGYGFVKILKGKRYHPYCFEKINNSSTPSKEKII